MRNRNSRLRRRLATLGTAAALVGGVGVATAGPASAATHKNGVCESGELCLYYLTDYRGPVFDLYVSDNDFSNDYFPGTSTRANDNTESVWNRDTYTWYVYVHANRGGSRGTLSPGSYGNFTTTYKNQVSSAYYYL
jgi:hypothetical protein